MVTPSIILLILLLPLILAKLTSRSLHNAAFVSLGAAFLFFAVGHFVQTQGMVAMLPPWLPARTLVVYLTGLLELVIGLALIYRPTRQPAAALAGAVLVLFFPVNVYAAVHAVGLGGHQWGPVYLWIRAPLQVLLVGWAIMLYRFANRITAKP